MQPRGSCLMQRVGLQAAPEMPRTSDDPTCVCTRCKVRRANLTQRLGALLPRAGGNILPRRCPPAHLRRVRQAHDSQHEERHQPPAHHLQQHAGSALGTNANALPASGRASGALATSQQQGPTHLLHRPNELLLVCQFIAGSLVWAGAAVRGSPGVAIGERLPRRRHTLLRRCAVCRCCRCLAACLRRRQLLRAAALGQALLLQGLLRKLDALKLPLPLFQSNLRAWSSSGSRSWVRCGGVGGAACAAPCQATEAGAPQGAHLALVGKLHRLLHRQVCSRATAGRGTLARCEAGAPCMRAAGMRRGPYHSSSRNAAPAPGMWLSSCCTRPAVRRGWNSCSSRPLYRMLPSTCRENVVEVGLIRAGGASQRRVQVQQAAACPQL